MTPRVCEEPKAWPALYAQPSPTTTAIPHANSASTGSGRSSADGSVRNNTVNTTVIAAASAVNPTASHGRTRSWRKTTTTTIIQARATHRKAATPESKLRSTTPA